MPKALQGAIIYEGPSRIDGSPIVVIATGLGGNSKNPKTGKMVQTWILRSDIDPITALRLGLDSAICGGCPLRPKWQNGVSYKKRACYVNILGPQSVYRAYKRGTYPRIPLDELAASMAGKMARLGSYGDPAAAPLEVWQAYTALASGRTGYTHQWANKRLRDVTALCQASVDSPEQAAKAQALGLGYFRVSPVGGEMLDGEHRCPASAEAGKRKTCIECGMCNGAAGLPIVIDAHGTGSQYVQPKASRRLVVV